MSPSRMRRPLVNFFEIASLVMILIAAPKCRSRP